MVGKVKDLTGAKFGRLTVLGLDHVANRKSYWLCQCECGAQKVIRADNLHSNTGRPVTLSCGCYNREKRTNLIDNRSKSKLYHVYYGILQRCNNPKAESYQYYGARGIKCKFADWEHFRDWAVNSGYKDGLTIDRINNDGDYEPSNCCWVTMQEQQLNKRQASDACLVEYEGKLVNLSQLSKLTGIKYVTLYYRFTHGLPLLSKV